MTTKRSVRRRGSALLAVLWLAAALATIAFAVANTVRGETERTSTAVDGLRGYYLATGGIDRALLWMIWGPQYRNPDGTPRYFMPPMPLIHYEFPTGSVNVEIIPESSKLNVNTAPPEQLQTLMSVIGVPADRAQLIVQGILDWRFHPPGGAFTNFDQYYLSLSPTFRSRHASLEEIEELLVIRGMTPELFYGRYEKSPDGNLLPRPGLKDCLSVYGGSGVFDINTVQPAVMVALGVPPESAALIVAMRRQMPFRLPQQFTSIPGAVAAHLGLGTSPMVTVRATAAPRFPDGHLSDMRRSVSALIAFPKAQSTPPYHIMRWYENAVAVQ